MISYYEIKIQSILLKKQKVCSSYTPSSISPKAADGVYQAEGDRYRGSQLYTKNSNGTYSAYTGTLYTNVYIYFRYQQGSIQVSSTTKKVTYTPSKHTTTTATVLASYVGGNNSGSTGNNSGSTGNTGGIIDGDLIHTPY